MGDTGSLTIGGIIAVLAIAVRKINSVVVWCFFSRKFIGRNPG
jgi:UDP-N-acetylmuramyl pentapeptide phosphotransferase/UDP-N-acetylglucosamine-1-phosphate transferase